MKTIKTICAAATLMLTATVPSAVLAAPAQDLASAAQHKATPEPEFTKCTKYFFYAVRGSGQSKSADGKWTGMGPQVKAVATRIDTTLANSTKPPTRFFGYNDYPAVKANAENLRSGAYTESVLHGVGQTLIDLEGIVAKCPNINISLIGYSQGAHVLHGAMYELSTEDEYKDVADNVDSVTLISDPARDLDGMEVRFVMWEGKTLGKNGALFDKDAPMNFADNADTNGKTISYCHYKDPVCNFPGKLLAASAFAESTHTTAYTKDARADTMAANVVSRLS